VQKIGQAIINATAENGSTPSTCGFCIDHSFDAFYIVSDIEGMRLSKHTVEGYSVG